MPWKKSSRAVPSSPPPLGPKPSVSRLLNVHFHCQVLVWGVTKVEAHYWQSPTAYRDLEAAAAAEEVQHIPGRRPQKRLARLKVGLAPPRAFGGTGARAPCIATLSIDLRRSITWSLSSRSRSFQAWLTRPAFS